MARQDDASQPRRRLQRLVAQLRAAQPGDGAAAVRPSPTVVSQPPEAELLPKRVHTEADDVAGASQLGLTAAEVEAFRRDGFLVKRGLISAEELAVGIEALWSAAAVLAPGLERDKPASWVDAGERWENSTPEPDGGRGPHRFDPNGQWRFHCLGTGADAASSATGARHLECSPADAERFLDATSRNPRMLAQVEAFIGGPVMQPRRNRGIYSIFPRSNVKPGFGPHLDSHTFQLCGMVYLGDVLPDAGGTTYWAGSHKLLYPAFDEEYNFLPSPDYGAAHQRARAECVPVEVTGRAGDVVFSHHRTLHSGGANRGTLIRMAVPCAEPSRIPVLWAAIFV